MKYIDDITQVKNLIIELGSRYYGKEFDFIHNQSVNTIQEFLAPITRQEVNTFINFQKLALIWREATRTYSSVTQICMHPAYQSIISKGKDVIPLILEEMKERPNHWFWALSIITGDNPPIRNNQRGKIKEMTAAWLKWGEEHGYIV